jgi:hypothetical protein
VHLHINNHWQSPAQPRAGGRRMGQEKH